MHVCMVYMHVTMHVNHGCKSSTDKNDQAAGVMWAVTITLMFIIINCSILREISLDLGDS